MSKTEVVAQHRQHKLKDTLKQEQQQARTSDALTQAKTQHEQVCLKVSQQSVEITHLRLDTQRMVHLITQTKEFEAFRSIDESGPGGGLSYLPTQREMSRALVQEFVAKLPSSCHNSTSPSRKVKPSLTSNDNPSLSQWGKSIVLIAKAYGMSVDGADRNECTGEFPCTPYV